MVEVEREPLTEVLIQPVPRQGNLPLGQPVGATNSLEEWSRKGTVDLHHLDLHAEEINAVDRDTIKPIDSDTMFIRELGGDPDDGQRVDPRGIGEDLPEVRMVGGSQLILDDDHVTVASAANDICPERAN